MPHSTEHGADLRAYLGVLRTRKWEILLITVLVVGAAVFFAFRQAPEYEGHAKVLVRPVQSFGTSTINLAQAPNLDTERQLIMSQAIGRGVQERLKPAPGIDTLLHNVGVDVVGTTEVLGIRYRSHDPETAAKTANAFADSYVRFRTQQTLGQFQTAARALEQRITTLQDQIRSIESQLAATSDQHTRDSLAAQRDSFVGQMGVMQSRLADLQSTASTVQSAAQVIQRAETPRAPVSPNKVRDAAMAVVAGLCLGIAFAFMRERLDDRVKGREELEARIGAPVIAVVPKIPGWRKRDETRLVMRAEPKSSAAEAYRTLATNVQFMAARQGLKVIIVTSSLAGEGKSTTSANLAVALAQSGRKVVLVSADLRKPRATQFFGVESGLGMSNVLSADVADPALLMLDPGVSNLRVLGSGPTPRNPAELLSSPRCATLIEHLRLVADLIVIDTPPVLAVADASILAALADGAIFVVDGERTRRSAIMQTRAQLETAGVHVIGVVYNNNDPSHGGGYSYYHDGYQPYYGSPTGSSPGRVGRGRGLRHGPRPKVVAGFSDTGLRSGT
jgi:capsular exopolysaccharide synthesis family protein